MKRAQISAIRDIQNAYIEQVREQRKRDCDAFLDRLREEWRRGCDNSVLQYRKGVFCGSDQGVPSQVLFRLDGYTNLSVPERRRALIDTARLLGETTALSDEFHKERMARDERDHQLQEQNRGKNAMIGVGILLLCSLFWVTPIALGVIAYRTGSHGFKVAAIIAGIIALVITGVASSGGPKPVIDAHDHANL